MRVRKAVLPVAGFGTRVLPATKAIPKEMLPVVDRPAIQYVVDEALEAGIEHIVFVTGRNKGSIEDYFDIPYELEVALEAKGKKAILEQVKQTTLPAGSASFVRQQSPLGLGHAVWCARDIVGHEPFAVLLPDDKVGGNIVAVDQVPMDRVSSYGVIAPKGNDRDGRLIEMTGMVEKPPVADAPSNLKITGRYILQPEVFGLLESQGKGAGGEIQLTDAMARLMEVQSFYAYEYEGQDYDCGSKLGYFEAVLGYALANEEIGEDAKALAKAMLDKL